MKYLIVILVVVLMGWWLLGRRPAAVQRKREQVAAPQAMIACSHCGVHLPAADAVVDAGGSYCSETHRLAGPR